MGGIGPTDEDIESVIVGRSGYGVSPELRGLIGRLRDVSNSLPDVQPDARLTAFLRQAPTSCGSPSSRNDRRSVPPKAMARVSAAMATTIGKVCLAVAMVAMTAGGAQAAEIIRIPGLAEPDHLPIEVIDVPTEPATPAENEDETRSRGSRVIAPTAGPGTGCGSGRTVSELASAKSIQRRQDAGRTDQPCAKAESRPVERGAASQANKRDTPALGKPTGDPDRSDRRGRRTD